jgi:hypothetical protein
MQYAIKVTLFELARAILRLSLGETGILRFRVSDIAERLAEPGCTALFARQIQRLDAPREPQQVAVRGDNTWRFIGHVGTGYSHKFPEDLRQGRTAPARLSRAQVRQAGREMSCASGTIDAFASSRVNSAMALSRRQGRGFSVAYRQA